MEIIRHLVIVLQFVVYFYLLFATFYLLLFAIAGLFYVKDKPIEVKLQRKFAVLIPGYKEDAVIIRVAKQALNQDYPSDKFDVIVIADSFGQATIDALKKIPIKLFIVEFEQSNKSRSLNKCMQNIGDDYDIAFVLDADNIMENNVLKKINAAFEIGYHAVQGHRTAKNLNTNFAILDALSEEINNHIFRKGHRVLGISSALIGSAMGIDYKLYKETMSSIDSMGGCEDKEVELKIIKNRIPIHYLDDAVVYDEKTQKSDAFVNQRRRWIACQFSNFINHSLDALIELVTRKNVDYFDKVFQMIPPPRILLTGILFIFSLLYAGIFLFLPSYLMDWFSPSYHYWSVLFILTVISLFLSIPTRLYNLKTFRALFSIPFGFLLMTLSLLKIKGAHKTWLHTKHTFVDDSVDEDFPS